MVKIAETDSTHKLSYIRKDGVENTVNITVADAKSLLVASLEQLGAFTLCLSCRQR